MTSPVEWLSSLYVGSIVLAPSKSTDIPLNIMPFASTLGALLLGGLVAM